MTGDGYDTPEVRRWKNGPTQAENCVGWAEIKGLSNVKIIRIATAFEIARRLSKEALRGKQE
jgi:hypothetical protein